MKTKQPNATLCMIKRDENNNNNTTETVELVGWSGYESSHIAALAWIYLWETQTSKMKEKTTKNAGN